MIISVCIFSGKWAGEICRVDRASPRHLHKVIFNLKVSKNLGCQNNLNQNQQYTNNTPYHWDLVKEIVKK